MLRELRVKNFAIIDRLSLLFKPGLNVLTGETGAGKSILIGALGIALGERAYSEMIKTGHEQASVEAYFDAVDNPPAVSMGISTKEGILLRRDISQGGKGRAYINDTLVSVQGLGDVGRTLVDIHGQHEHESLLSAESQMGLLDYYGKTESERKDVSIRFSEAEALRKAIDNLRQAGRDRAQRIDLLKFQINEIDAASLKPAEDRALEEEMAILSNLSRLNELAETAYMDLYSEEGSALEKLSSAASKLREMSSIDPSASEPLNALSSALPLLQDASATLRGIKERYNPEPGRLDKVDDRLHLIGNLKKKYGDTIDAVLSYKDKIEKELEAIEVSDEKIKEMETGLKEKEDGLLNACLKLSEKRQKAARRLEAEIKDGLKELALQKADFRIEVGKAQLSSSGTDAVGFLFSANPGEALKPLMRVASGGELSRIMLAIKSVLREESGIPVMIFDEVDAGIGGKTAENVARKLKDLSSSNGRQVICITHLPQIASMADCHLLIEKAVLKDTVHVIIKELSGKEKQEEIARMLSGKLTETSLRHAAELLEGAMTSVKGRQR